MSREERTITVFSEPAAAGFTASNVGGETYQMLLARGATISDFKSGQQLQIKTRAFTMDESLGGMVVVDLDDPKNRPQIVEEPPPEVQLGNGRTLAPVNQAPVTTPPPAPLPMTNSPAPNMADVISASINNGKPAVRQPAQLVANQSVTFITPLGDFDFPCFFVGREGQWITLIGATFPKVNSDVNIDLKIDGKVISCYSPGINVEIKLGEHTARMANFLDITNEH